MRPATILIIDDDNDSRLLLGELMRLNGHDVLLEPNGLCGLQTARAFRPSLILLDLHMPVMDGVTFRRHQRADPAIADIPVVCVSAVDPASAYAQELGDVPYVGKPIDFDELQHVIDGLLSHQALDEPAAGGSTALIGRRAESGAPALGSGDRSYAPLAIAAVVRPAAVPFGALALACDADAAAA